MPTVDRDATRQWLQGWAVAGPLLDDERWARLTGASDEELNRHALNALSLWQPGVAGDDGEALLEQQRVFLRA